MKQTSALIKNYLDEQQLLPSDASQPVFFNRQGKKLTRKGIAYILKKYVTQAEESASMPNFNITPHTLRHTKAMHLLHADINMFYIRDILGHKDVSTTEIYAKIDAEKKREILERVSKNIPEKVPSWKQDPNLMIWLKNLS